MSCLTNDEIDLLQKRLDAVELKLSSRSDDCRCHKSVETPRESQDSVELSGQTNRRSGVSGLTTGRASIDHTTNDNGFLNCVRSVWGNSSNLAVFSHPNTATAFSNVRGGSQGFSLICGHGGPGIIVTGTGQTVDGVDKYMSVGNENAWRPFASQGITGTQLTLFGCQVAAGAAGAAFLRRVASAVRKPVGAWTGDVWCGNGSTWGTGSFIVVQPGMAFEPVEAPTMFEEKRRRTMLRLPSHENHEEIKPEQIKQVNFTPVGSLAEKQETFTATGKEAAQVLELIDFERPFVTEDKPGAILTGLLTVVYETSSGEKVRAFRLLGYTLVQDVLFPNTYYYASKDLQGALFKAGK